VLPLLVAALSHGAREDPSGVLLLSGLVSAAALYAFGTLAPPVAKGVFGASIAIGFALGGLLTGFALSVAILQAWFYPALPGRFEREDDHFFLAPLLFWVPLALVTALLWFSGAEVAREAFAHAATQWRLAAEEIQLLHQRLLESGSSRGALGWLLEEPGTFLASIVAAAHALVAYLATRWVRRRLGLIARPSVASLSRFRIQVRYAVPLILALALLVLTPYAGSATPKRLALPLLAWISAGCLLAGIGCAMHYALALWRRMAVASAARGASRPFGFALLPLTFVLLILCAPGLLICLGLVDIWFDTRKLTPKKGEK
jgi:hypothetical protein